jgi:hypothetical protein
MGTTAASELEEDEDNCWFVKLQTYCLDNSYFCVMLLISESVHCFRRHIHFHNSLSFRLSNGHFSWFYWKSNNVLIPLMKQLIFSKNRKLRKIKLKLTKTRLNCRTRSMEKSAYTATVSSRYCHHNCALAAVAKGRFWSGSNLTACTAIYSIFL